MCVTEQTARAHEALVSKVLLEGVELGSPWHSSWKDIFDITIAAVATSAVYPPDQR